MLNASLLQTHHCCRLFFAALFWFILQGRSVVVDLFWCESRWDCVVELLTGILTWASIFLLPSWSRHIRLQDIFPPDSRTYFCPCQPIICPFSVAVVFQMLFLLVDTPEFLSRVLLLLLLKICAFLSSQCLKDCDSAESRAHHCYVWQRELIGCSVILVLFISGFWLINTQRCWPTSSPWRYNDAATLC